MTEQTTADAPPPSPTDAARWLPRSTPGEQGLDPAAVSGLLDEIEGAGLELHSLMVLRHGHVVAEGWWAPYEPSGLHLLYSLSKSFTSTAVGLAVHEGLLAVDDLVTSFFPGSVPAELDARTARMTVAHLLSMASGHREDTLPRLDRLDPVRSFLALPPEEEPGTWFTYNNGATLMLSAIVTELTGQRLLDYLRPRLLTPLGITEATWAGLGPAGPTSPDTHPLLDQGFSGLHLPTEAIARFGQLYLQRGRWRGEQLLPQEWVAAATRTQVDNPREPNPDWRQGYGYQFWMARHGYRGDGAFGQFCLVLPEEDAVVAITSATEDMQAVLDAVWAHLWPALQPDVAVPAADGAGSQLVDRLGRLTLPVVEGAREPGADVVLPWTAPPVAADPPPAQADAATVDPELRLLAVEEVPDGWRLTLADSRAELVVGCGYGHWTRSECAVGPEHRLQVAASGAWTEPGVFTAAVDLVQTPHRLVLRCDTGRGLTTAHWNVAPLGPTGPSRLALELARG